MIRTLGRICAFLLTVISIVVFLEYSTAAFTYAQTPTPTADPTQTPQPSPDSDSDGLSDANEAELGTDPNKRDTDDDGLDDKFETGQQSVTINGAQIQFKTDPTNPDSDGDSLTDGDEYYGAKSVIIDGAERSATSNPQREDTDDDGLKDGDEVNVHGTDPGRADSDGDGLEDGDELGHPDMATDPTRPDSDGDGLSDGDELQHRRTPTDPTKSDTDGDGLTDKEELDGLQILIAGELKTIITDPTKTDTDTDGLSDSEEAHGFPVIIAGKQRTVVTNPKITDTDGDGISDFNETQGINSNLYGATMSIPTDPSLKDTDGDGLSDSKEESASCNPQLDDTDSDGQVDGRGGEINSDCEGPDTDQDFLSDGFERSVSLTDPEKTDSDEDGLSDGKEYLTLGTDPLKPDTDGDGLTDGDEVKGVFFTIGQDSWTKRTDPLSLDTDGDGLSDSDEINGVSPQRPGTIPFVTDPTNPDTDGDGTLDGLDGTEQAASSAIQPSTAPTVASTEFPGAGFTDTTPTGPGLGPSGNNQPINPQEVASTETDTDEDGLTDVEEINGILMYIDEIEKVRKTNPTLRDTDGDGLWDGYEVELSTDPTEWDTDGDGISDFVEVNGFQVISLGIGPVPPMIKTDPTLADTDGDGVSDGKEREIGTNPTEARGSFLLFSFVPLPFLLVFIGGPLLVLVAGGAGVMVLRTYMSPAPSVSRPNDSLELLRQATNVSTQIDEVNKIAQRLEDRDWEYVFNRNHGRNASIDRRTQSFPEEMSDLVQRANATLKSLESKAKEGRKDIDQVSTKLREASPLANQVAQEVLKTAPASALWPLSQALYSVLAAYDQQQREKANKARTLLKDIETASNDIKSHAGRIHEDRLVNFIVDKLADQAVVNIDLEERLLLLQGIESNLKDLSESGESQQVEITRLVTKLAESGIKTDAIRTHIDQTPYSALGALHGIFEDQVEQLNSGKAADAHKLATEVYEAKDLCQKEIMDSAARRVPMSFLTVAETLLKNAITEPQRDASQTAVRAILDEIYRFYLPRKRRNG